MIDYDAIAKEAELIAWLNNPYQYTVLLRKFIERFIVREDGCWQWIGTLWGRKPNHLYGRFQYGKSGQISAHRLSFLLFKGEITEGHFVLHRCDYPPCVNPDHLFQGTHKDNINDALEKGRFDLNGQYNSVKTHCPKGHPYDEENTYWLLGKWRACKTCQRERQRVTDRAELKAKVELARQGAWRERLDNFMATKEAK